MTIKNNNKQVIELKSIIPIISYQNLLKEYILVIKITDLLVSLMILKNHITYQYKLLSCISGIDLLNSNYRFCIAYDLLSIIFNIRIRVKIFFPKLIKIKSIVPIFKNANWWEREIWDMFGIYFENHPDLRRILTDYGFDGFPLLKDFPLSGFIEVFYSEREKKVIMGPVNLPQEYRVFHFTMPW